MDETTEKDNGTLRVGERKTLSLKGSADSVLIKQNFARGRSKSVIVEKKRNRFPGSGGQAASVSSKPDEQLTEVARKQDADPITKPSANGMNRRKVQSSKERFSQAGVKSPIHSLTEGERDARAFALADAIAREEAERRRREQQAREEAEGQALSGHAHHDQPPETAVPFCEVGAVVFPVDVPGIAEVVIPVVNVRKVERAAGTKFSGPHRGDLDDEEAASPRGRRSAGDARSALRVDTKASPKSGVREGERRRSRLTVTNALQEETERSRSMASIRRQRARAQVNSSTPAPKISREVIIPEMISIQELANRMAERAADVVKMLMRQGQMVKITELIDADLAQLIAEEMGHTVRRVADSDVEEGLFDVVDDAALLVPRSPVVTVMGHVDHGKTSLLDALRRTSVVAGEAGGITQHIRAYRVDAGKGKVTFIDTPGHAAFRAMRERGAKVTDIVVLVIAADDGVMPQTVEVINHARAAGVPILVAINKIDRPGADPGRVRIGLLQHGVVVEALGGDVIDVEVSALQSLNLDKLLEMILLQAEILDLRAISEGVASGAVIEARLDKGRGAVTTVLVQRGRLRVGDVVVAGCEWGRVRALISDRNISLSEAGPSEPVEILGVSGISDAGDCFVVVASETRAREITDYRRWKKKENCAVRTAHARGSLEQMMNKLKTGECSRLAVVVKGDARGSVEAIIGALNELCTDEVRAQVVHSGVGAITETDISLASGIETLVLGFNVRANRQAREAADQRGLKIRYYNIIYDLVDDMKQIMSGLLAPELRESFLGNAEVLEIFNITKTGKVAGCRVIEGKVERGASVRLLRDHVVIHQGKLSILKRFKDEVKEVAVGQECGMAFENYEDMRPGDIIECFRVESIKRNL